MREQDWRIEAVEALAPAVVRVKWVGQDTLQSIDLAGWIETAGDILAPLRDPAVFKNASVSDYGAAVSWDDGRGDLSIDGNHLYQLAEEQKSFAPLSATR